jgi:hypothetical protein
LREKDMFASIKKENQRLKQSSLCILHLLIIHAGEIQTTCDIISKLEIFDELEITNQLQFLKRQLLISQQEMIPQILLTPNGLVRFTIEESIRNNMVDLDFLIKSHLQMILLFTLMRSPEGLRKSNMLIPFQNQLKIFGIRLYEKQFKSVIDSVFSQQYVYRKMLETHYKYVITDLGTQKLLQEMNTFVTIKT